MKKSSIAGAACLVLAAVFAGLFVRGRQAEPVSGTERSATAIEASAAAAAPPKIADASPTDMADGTEAAGESTTSSSTPMEAVASPGQFVVAGRVYEERTNAPVEGVVLGAGGFLLGPSGEIQPGAHVTTGPDGKYRLVIDAVEEGRSASLSLRLPSGWVIAERPVSEYIFVDAPPAGETATVDIALARGVELSGIVVMPDGRTPVAGAIITMQDPASYRAGTMSRSCDSEGRFAFPAKPGMTVKLSAREGGQSGGAEGESTVTVPAEGVPDSVTIVLRSSTIVRGVVVSGGEPVPDARVFLSTRPFQGMHYRGRTARTDGQGAFEFTGDYEGRVHLGAEPPPGSLLARSEPQTLDLARGEVVKGIAIEMRRGLFIEGVVTDADGQPIEGAAIHARIRTGPGASTGGPNALTDGDGYYVLGGLGSDEVLESVSAQHADYQYEHRTISGIEESPVNFMLERQFGIPIRAVAGDVPVASYEYRVLPFYDNGGTSYLGGSDGLSKWTKVSSGDGRTMTEPRPSNRYAIEVRETDGSGGPSGRMGRGEASVFRGERTAEVVVDLAGGQTVQGHVVAKESGAPVAGATVGLFLKGYWPSDVDAFSAAFLSGESDASGAFRFEDVPAGKWTVMAALDGAVEGVSIAVGEADAPEPVMIELTLAVPVIVVATDENGRPVTEPLYHFWITRQGTAFPEIQGPLVPDAEGQSHVGSLSTGKWFLWIGTKPTRQNGDAKTSFRIDSGSETKTVSVRVTPTVQLEGTVTINGKPWPGTPRIFLDDPSTYIAALRPLGDGRYTAECRAGTVWYNLEASDHSVGRRIGSLAVSSSKNPAIRDIALELCEVTVVCLFPEGEEFREGSVGFVRQGSPESWGGMPITQTTDTKLFRDVPAGDYVATYRSRDGGWTGESEVTAVGIGNENVIVVEVAEKERGYVAVGGWDSANLGTEFVDLRFPAPADRTSWGVFGFRLEHLEGSGSVQISEVVLEIGGSEIAAYRRPTELNGDQALSWNEQRIRPTAEGGGTVRVRIRSRGDGDSRGVVSVR